MHLKIKERKKNTIFLHEGFSILLHSMDLETGIRSYHNGSEQNKTSRDKIYIR